MSKENMIELHTRLTRADVAGLIEALTEGLKDGNLKIHKSDELLDMEVPRVIDLHILASADNEKASVAFELFWRTNRPEIPEEADVQDVDAVGMRCSSGKQKDAGDSEKKAAKKTEKKNGRPKTASKVFE